MDKQLTKQKNNFLGSGWAFPVTFSIGTGELELTQYEDNVNQNIQLILNTKRGEHCMEQNFGSGLQQFMFRKMDETLKGDMIDTIENSLLNYEPRITLLSVDVDFVDQTDGLVNIALVYKYNQTNTRHNYVFPFNLIEGTNLKA